MSDGRSYSADEVAELLSRQRRPEKRRPRLPRLSKTEMETLLGAGTIVSGIVAAFLSGLDGIGFHIGFEYLAALLGTGATTFGAGVAHRASYLKTEATRELNANFADDIGAIEDEDEFGPER